MFGGVGPARGDSPPGMHHTYGGVVLEPACTVNGRPAWSAVGGGLHLLYHSNLEKWAICETNQPNGDNALAVSVENGLPLPPVGHIPGSTFHMQRGFILRNP